MSLLKQDIKLKINMKVKDLLEELCEKECYKKFIGENPSAFFAAAFFIMDLKQKTETIQLDFFLPEQKKITAFEYPFIKAKIFDEEMKSMTPQATEIKINIDDLESVCKEIIKNNDSLIIATKIIAILKDNQWNLTCMDDMLGIVRIKINAINGKQIAFSKGSLMDFMGIKKK